jgi:hypothetical protein
MNPWEAMRSHAPTFDSLHLQTEELFPVSATGGRQPTTKKEATTQIQSRWRSSSSTHSPASKENGQAACPIPLKATLITTRSTLTKF